MLCCSYFRPILSPHLVLLGGGGGGGAVPQVLAFPWLFAAQTEECNTAGLAELIFIFLIGLIV